MTKEKLSNISKTTIVAGVLSAIAMIALFAASLYLFYNQSLSNNEVFASDLPIHLRTGRKGGGYSLMTKIFWVLLSLWDNTLGCAIALAVIIVLTVFATGWLLKYLFEKAGIKTNYFVLLLVSMIFLFVGNMYIPDLFEKFYAGSANTQPWHNSSYLLMRLFSVLAIGFYFKIEENYLTEIKVKDWLLFTLFLTLSNWSKPSFLIAFAPIMLVYLIIDFIRRRTKGTVQMIKFGTAVLCSLPICFWQAGKLWPSEDSGSGENDGGVTITLEKLVDFFQDSDSVWYVIAGFSFPLLVTLVCLICRQKSKILTASWLMYIVSWLEQKMLVEYGERAAHGNFGWGRKFFAYFLYMVAFVECIRLYKEKKIPLVVCIIVLLVGLANIACGMYYFGQLLQGSTYYF